MLGETSPGRLEDHSDQVTEVLGMRGVHVIQGIDTKEPGIHR